MGNEENKKSKALEIIFWIATIGCFIFGYYNTHLGLRTFNAFGSGNGSWFLAAIPLVMVVGGYIASVKGTKWMLALYLTGEIIFFVFNLTYLYPTYLGRTLVKEEAQILSDSLNVYQNRIDGLIIKKAKGTGTDFQELTKDISDLRVAKKMLLREIRERNGFGPEATKQLEIINKIAGTSYTPDRDLGKTQEEREEKYRYWEKEIDNVIKEYRKKMIGEQQVADKLFEIQDNMDSLSNIYSVQLELFLQDDAVSDNDKEKETLKLQSKKLNELTTQLDNLAEDVNSIEPYTFYPIAASGKGIPFPKTQQLGTFQHTMISVRDRFNKLDTWGVIIICFFFDLLGPFLFYFYLRKDDSEEDSASDDGWNDGQSLWKRIFEKE